MAFNMVSGFMVTRLRAALWALGVVVCAALATLSCEKVPLLAPTGSVITLSTATSALGFNGTADVSAQVLESAGTPPHSGTHVTFSTNLGFVEPAEVQTDVNGRATTRFFAGTSSGIATITASSGGASVAAANAVKIAVGSAAVSAVVASANPSVVSQRGGNATISAKVTDAGGNALGGIPVTFTTDAGSMSESVSNTNAQGIATSILSTNRTAKVTATAGVATTTTTPPPTGGTGTGTTTTTAPSTSTVTVTVNTTASITIGTPSPASPQVGQTVSFPLTYPASTAGASAIIRVDVDWGDGRRESFNSTPSAISHAYGSAASFLVVVTGFDALGDTATASQSVTVVPRLQPTVTISSTPSNPSAGQTVTFTISATPSAGNAITSMSIDFGDGQSASLPGNASTVQHVYNTSGSKQVTATATDTSGASGSASTVIVVGTTAGPTASFTVNPSSGTISTNFQFDASASTGTALTFQWNFGDSMAGSGQTTSHTYATTGAKTVTLTVTDNQGRTATATRTVTVTTSVR
jgi:PKD repeat protein